MADSRQRRVPSRTASEQRNEGEGSRSKVRQAAEKARQAIEAHGRELTEAVKQDLAKGRR